MMQQQKEISKANWKITDNYIRSLHRSFNCRFPYASKLAYVILCTVLISATNIIIV